MRRPMLQLAVALTLSILMQTTSARSVAAQTSLLEETVSFSGQVLFLETGVPGLVIGAVRDGDRAVFGFGETERGNGVTPDGDTLMRVGSITKVFTGAVLAEMSAEGEIGLTDSLQQHLDGTEIPELGSRPIRLIDLATHTSGLPRELDRPAGPDDDPFATLTHEAYLDALSAGVQLFPAGTGGLYSNFGFDMLAVALEKASGKAYPSLLSERILDPLGLEDTGFAPRDADRLMSGHGFDGEVLPDIPTSPAMVGASGLYSSANDMLTWMEWHLDDGDRPETRLLDHAAFVPRDGLDPAYGFDESGDMDAMGLGWIVMQQKGNQPFILQKAGGLQGMFLYHAFAPSHDIGVFIAINQFDFAASAQIAQMANDLIAQLATR